MGKSRAAWQTSFIVPQLNLLLDAGVCINKSRPKHVFLTHGHADHAGASIFFVKREDPPDIFCPAGMRTVFDNFILANTMLNLGGEIKIEDASAAGRIEGDRTEEHDPGRSADERAWLNTHLTYGVKHGDVIPLRRLKNIDATVFDCDHTVPCVGYVFCQTVEKLKPEYRSLAGLELKALRQSGTPITAPQRTPLFAFLGDTTAKTLADEPEWLRNGIPVVITECSFLEEEHREQASKTKHTIWTDLEKVVRKWPKTTFILTHFSLRYTSKAIVDFFASLPDCPDNIVVWADEEADTQ